MLPTGSRFVAFSWKILSYRRLSTLTRKTSSNCCIQIGSNIIYYLTNQHLSDHECQLLINCKTNSWGLSLPNLLHVIYIFILSVLLLYRYNVSNTKPKPIITPKQLSNRSKNSISSKFVPWLIHRQSLSWPWSQSAYCLAKMQPIGKQSVLLSCEKISLILSYLTSVLKTSRKHVLTDLCFSLFDVPVYQYELPFPSSRKAFVTHNYIFALFSY